MFLLWLAALAGSADAPKPVPIGARGWITTEDYPSAALRENATGPVTVVLQVDEKGGVRACTVYKSSGQPLLDDTTCNLLSQRARFTPAIDPANGKAVASVYSQTVHWAIPTDPVPPLPQGAPFFAPPPMPGVPGSSNLARLKARGPIFFGNVEPVSADIAPTPPAGAYPVPDPTIRRGTLPNGLRYAIMHNRVPQAFVSLRMRVEAGAIDEGPTELGYAHLVEHMVLRGSRSFPDGEYKRRLSAMGLRLGADIRANTYYDATIFGLDFPSARAGEARIGLSMLRDIAGRATLASSALASERGVVLAEERSEDSPARRSTEARLAFYLPGQAVGRHAIIGTVDTISRARAEDLRRFYERHYRPERVILLVVGDIPPEEAERDIQMLFGDWTGTGPAAPLADRGYFRSREAQAGAYLDPGLTDYAELAWGRPFQRVADSLDRRRRLIADMIVATIFNERMVRVADGDDAPFFSASLARQDILESADITSIAIQPIDGRMEQALAAALAGQKRLVQFGVTQAEVDRAIAKLNVPVQSGVTGASTRRTSPLADMLLTAVVNDQIVGTPAQDAVEFGMLAKQITTQEVERAAARLFQGSGPLLFVSQKQGPPGAEAALGSMLTRLKEQPASQLAGQSAGGWPYASFGPAGKIVERKHIEDVGVTMVRFANGATLTLKTSRLPKDEILADLNFGFGFSGLPAGLERSYWMALPQTSPFISGGLGKMSAVDVAEHFAATGVGASFWADEDRFHLTGMTNNANFDAQIQLLTAYFADPAFRPSSLARAKSAIAAVATAYDASASLTLQRDLAFLLHDKDPRWSLFPSPAQLAASRPEDMSAIFRPSLAGPANLTIVGDVDTERAIAIAQATIGALPPRGSRPAPPVPRFPRPGAEPETVLVHGRQDQSVVVAAWPTPGFYPNTADSRALQVLAKIVEDRLIEGLRAKDGLTYSPAAFIDQSIRFASYGMIAARVEISPDKADRFFAELDKIMSDLARHSVSAAELDRARSPTLELSRVNVRSTGYWFDALVGVDEDPRGFDTIRSRIPELVAVSPGDIQRLARTYLAGKPPYRLIVRSAP